MIVCQMQNGNNIVEVFESLTTSFSTMDTPLFNRHLGVFDALSHLMLNILTITNTISISYLQVAQNGFQF